MKPRQLHCQNSRRVDFIDRAKRAELRRRKKNIIRARIKFMARIFLAGLICLTFSCSLNFIGLAKPGESSLGQEHSPKTAAVSPLPAATSFSRRKGQGAEAIPAFTQGEAKEQLAQLQEKFPDGRYWNHVGVNLSSDSPWDSVSDLPCNHDADSTRFCNTYASEYNRLFPQYDELRQCLGFAALLSNCVFGESAPINTLENYQQLRIGDHIRLHENMHSMTVIDKTEAYISVAEVNADYNSCMISWGRQLSWGEVADLDWDATYFTRYEL